MPMTETTQTTLAGLVGLCKDREVELYDASSRVERAKLQKLLNEYSLQCSRAATELQEEMVRLGSEPPDTSSVGSRIQRGWRAVRARLPGDSGAAELRGLSRNEHRAVREFQRALRSTELSDTARETIERQLREAESARDIFAREADSE